MKGGRGDGTMEYVRCPQLGKKAQLTMKLSVCPQIGKIASTA